ncbi:MAG: PilZ domain-containing protein [Desulfosarcinaceae bacterium]|nr:PilZ domain-containing protein [Desulfosarcinaceae bacterium]
MPIPNHRKRVPVRIDRREHPRLDFRCAVLIKGLPGVKHLADISMGGVFIDLEPGHNFQIDQELWLNLRLPTETQATKVKARISYLDQMGIGCMFVELRQEERRQIQRCFDTFKDTLPIDE